MALDTLSSGLQALGLHDPDSLLFNPLKDQAWLRSKFNSIPRYLFRVSTPVSYCTTDNVWVKSMDARLAEPTGDVDILSRHDNHEVANMLNSHLSWGKQPSDNFVSWTSSLLFALQYVIYLHKYSKETPSLEEINLCVIDTAAFPPGVFLQDLDLIDAYKSYNNGLQDLEGLRRRQYYFGEYLSQGALKIENKCQIVSTRAIFDRGLFSLQPEFNISMTNGKRTWAKEVLRLRESFSYYALITSSISPQEIQAAKSIAQLFGPRWRLPVAANLMALSPHRSSDPALRQVFKAPPFTDTERDECSPAKTEVMVSHSMPEVQQFRDIMRTIYFDFRSRKLRNDFGAFKARLDTALDNIRQIKLNMEKLVEEFERDLSSIDA